MGDLGFWALAQEDPSHVAVVEPDGNEVSAGDLLARSNRIVRGLRRVGVEPGDSVAVCLPNCTEYLVAYLSCLQAGWYLVPINHHLVAPEIAYILSDCEAKSFIGHEQFADVCSAAANDAGVEARHCFAVGQIAGFCPFAQLSDGESADSPEDRLAGLVMNYTSGTTGRPKGI